MVERRPASAKPSRSPCSATPPRSCPSWCVVGASPTSSPTRPPPTIPSTAICPKGWTLAEWEERRVATQGVERAAKASWPSMCARCWRYAQPASRRSTTATTSARWRSRRASRTPSSSRDSCRPISGRCSAKASGRSAGWRSRAIPRTFPDGRQGQGALSRQRRICTGGSTWRGAHPVPGPAGAHLLARPRRPPPPRPRLQRDGGEGRSEGADRDRPRPPRFRLGRQPQPRDRGDEGRLRRGLRLADAERAVELRLRRHLGLAPSRRRRRHGLLAARRHGRSSATARRRRRGGSSGCYGTTRRPASCATPTRATRSRSHARGRRGSTCRVWRGDPSGINAEARLQAASRCQSDRATGED